MAPYTNKYNEISQAISHLSLKRQGALIVIQREDPIDKWITPGIPLSAEISSSLVESIFVTSEETGKASFCLDGKLYPFTLT
ncbi:MAG: diadenylate cyclase [Bacillota bacterium]